MTTNLKELPFEELQKRAEAIRYRIYRTMEKKTTKAEYELLEEYAERTNTARNWRTVGVARRMNRVDKKA